MKQLSYDGAAWLLDDDAADALIEYAVALGRKDSADSVELHAINPDGHAELVAFLIGPATMMTSETTTSEFEEPDNARAVIDLRKRSRDAAPAVPAPTVQTQKLDYLDEF